MTVRPSHAAFHCDSTKQAGTVVAFPKPFARTELINDVYRRTILSVALQALGVEVLHASAIATPDGIVALCAKSCTGKSTLAYALHRRGHPLWADDAVALEVTDSGISSFALPFAVRLRPEAKAFFGSEPVLPFPALPKTEAVNEKPVSIPLTKLVILRRAQPGDAVGASSLPFKPSPDCCRMRIALACEIPSGSS